VPWFYRCVYFFGHHGLKFTYYAANNVLYKKRLLKLITKFIFKWRWPFYLFFFRVKQWSFFPTNQTRRSINPTEESSGTFLISPYFSCHWSLVLKVCHWKLYHLKLSNSGCYCKYLEATSSLMCEITAAVAQWFDPRLRHTKDVKKMVPDASLLSAQHRRIGLASLSARTLFKKRDGYHLEWAVEND